MSSRSDSMTKEIDISFEGYFFMVDEHYALMADEEGEVVCVIQDVFFNRH